MIDLNDMSRFTFWDLIPYISSEFTAHEFFVSFAPNGYNLQEPIPCPNILKGKCAGGVLRPSTRLTKSRFGIVKSVDCFSCSGANSSFSKGIKACCYNVTPKVSPAIKLMSYDLYYDIRTSTFTASQILILTYCWAVRLSIRQLEMFTGITKMTLIRWASKFRHYVCHKMYQHRNEIYGQLGHDGLGDIQIDETLLFSRTNYRKRQKRLQLAAGGHGNFGNRISGPWIFGLAWRKPDPKTGKMRVAETRFFEVTTRDRRTLLTIIKREVAPGMTIISDEWGAYRYIDKLRDCNYTHLIVCHKKNFVDPTTKANINAIEGQWLHLKNWYMRQMRGCSNPKQLESHLSEYWWRSINNFAGTNLFLAFWRDVHLHNGL